jgi:hypothetical protein
VAHRRKVGEQVPFTGLTNLKNIKFVPVSVDDVHDPSSVDRDQVSALAKKASLVA